MSGGFLLLRRGGRLWGIANAAVAGLARGEGAFRVSVDGTVLRADEIVGVVERLRVLPLAPAVRRFWPEPAAGLAVHGAEPVVVVDPARLPAALRWEEDREERREEGEQP